MSKILIGYIIQMMKCLVDRPLARGIKYTVSQCTDTPNFVFVIKKGGLGQTLEIYNFFLAQLA